MNADEVVWLQTPRSLHNLLNEIADICGMVLFLNDKDRKTIDTIKKKLIEEILRSYLDKKDLDLNILLSLATFHSNHDLTKEEFEKVKSLRSNLETVSTDITNLLKPFIFTLDKPGSTDTSVRHKNILVVVSDNYDADRITIPLGLRDPVLENFG